MGQRGAQIVIRGKRMLHKRDEFRVMETVPKFWIAGVCVGTDVSGCCAGGSELLRKRERWLFLTRTNGTCSKPKSEPFRENLFAIKHCSPPTLREILSILREPL